MTAAHTLIDDIRPTPPGDATACRFGPLGHIGYADDHKRMKIFDSSNT